MKKFLMVVFTSAIFLLIFSGCKNYQPRFYSGDTCACERTRKGKMPKDAFKPHKVKKQKWMRD